MKLPSYDVPGGQSNINWPDHTHNSPTAVAFNPGTPSKVPTMYGRGKKKTLEAAEEFPRLFEQAQERATRKREESEFEERSREKSRRRAKQSERVA